MDSFFENPTNIIFSDQLPQNDRNKWDFPVKWSKDEHGTVDSFFFRIKVSVCP